MYIDSIHSINLVKALGKPLLQFKYFKNHQIKIQLIDAESGNLRDPFSGQECLELAEQQLKVPIPIVKAELLEKHATGVHHKYKKNHSQHLRLH